MDFIEVWKFIQEKVPTLIISVNTGTGPDVAVPVPKVPSCHHLSSPSINVSNLLSTLPNDSSLTTSLTTLLLLFHVPLPCVSVLTLYYLPFTCGTRCTVLSNLLIVYWCYADPETRVGIKIMQTVVSNLLPLHRLFLMAMKWSNHIQNSW